MARADASYARAIAVDERAAAALGSGEGGASGPASRALGLVSQAAPQRSALWFRRGQLARYGLGPGRGPAPFGDDERALGHFEQSRACIEAAAAQDRGEG